MHTTGTAAAWASAPPRSIAPTTRRRARRSPWRRALVLVLTGTSALLGLSSCGVRVVAEPDPIVLQPAPLGLVDKLDLSAPKDLSGLTQFDRWPKACDLLTNLDLVGVLPQLDTNAVTRTGSDRTLEFPSENDGVRRVEVSGASCRLTLALPGTGLDGRGGPEHRATIAVRVVAAGDSEAVAAELEPGTDEVREVLGAQCVLAATESGASCWKDNLAFSVRTSFPHQVVSGTRWTDRFRIGNDLTTFVADAADPSVGTVELQSEIYRRDALDLELAKIIIAKI